MLFFLSWHQATAPFYASSFVPDDGFTARWQQPFQTISGGQDTGPVRFRGTKVDASKYSTDAPGNIQKTARLQGMDAVASRPPYYGALDYGRDNRLRLWFLGVDDYRKIENELTSNEKVYLPQMTRAVGEILRVLRPGKCAALVPGDYNRNGRSKDSGMAIIEIVKTHFSSDATADKVLVDEVPDERRTRRRTQTTKQESVVLIRKLGAP